MHKKIPLLLTLCTVFALAAPSWSQANLKIAVIDVEKILTESVRGKEVLQALEKLRSEKATELQTKKKAFDDLKARYDETRLTLAEDRLADMEKQLEDSSIELRRLQDDAQRALEKQRDEDFGKIEQAVTPIIDEVGREFGYSLIFKKFQSGLIFADEAIDITNLIIERFNAKGAG